MTGTSDPVKILSNIFISFIGAGVLGMGLCSPSIILSTQITFNNTIKARFLHSKYIVSITYYTNWKQLILHRKPIFIMNITQNQLPIRFGNVVVFNKILQVRNPPPPTYEFLTIDILSLIELNRNRLKWYKICSWSPI